MHWAFFALSGYFLLAVSQLLDKFLLSGKRIPDPAVYAFYVALFSLFSFVFAPFGLGAVEGGTALLIVLSSFLFLYGLLAFYYAVRDYEISRIAPLHGLITALTVFAGALALPELFGEVPFDALTVFALVLMIAGGFLVAYDLPLRKTDHFPVSVVLSGVGVGASSLLLKSVYLETGFVSGLVWSRLAIFAAGLSLLLIPLYRRQIFRRHKKMAGEKKRTAVTGGLFIVNKSLAGGATMLLLYALSLGPASFVNALNGTMYVFLLLLAIPVAHSFPHVFEEKMSLSDWLQKIVAIVLIMLGFALMAFSGFTLRT